jgi:hypothetical protein
LDTICLLDYTGRKFLWYHRNPTKWPEIEPSPKIVQEICNPMIDTTVQKQLREQLEHLPAEQQHQALEFARSLVKAKGSGVPGKDLLKFAGAI